ncbi:hypothetical protein [Pedobacter aquatilis]|uniref:hypothetical protein n=1 Tax=Pedobacter aquatilis TaxID=351343 RepID=UPI00292F6229|nr:hypothetical protein [Pedobacter aquatilis]
MQKFNSIELAAFAANYARQMAGQPETYYLLMKSSLEAKVKKSYKQVLTEDELRDFSINLAKNCLKYFNSITDEGIYRNISLDIKKRASEQGLNLKAEDKYFRKLTKEMAKVSMNKCWEHISKKLKNR